MDLLTIKHKDFKLYIECEKYASVYGKAKSNIKEESLTSRYTWSEGVEVVCLNKELELKQNEPSRAIFFDNTDYSVWVDFEDNVRNVKYLSSRVGEGEYFKIRHNVMSGFLNYGNDIGLSEIKFRYELEDGTQKVFAFGFEVLSTKLDYHSHWKKIVADIEEEYRMLSLDYLRRTCHSFSEGKGESFDLIWWNVFQKIQSEFIVATQNILDRPRHRLRPHQEYKRADKIRRFTPQLEQEFAQHRKESGHLYMVNEQENSNNTLENRFLKHTLYFVEKKFRELLNRVKQFNQLSEEVRKVFEKQGETLAHLTRNPFFRTVGSFEGLRQESLILQKDTNYSKIYRASIVLRKSFSLNEGMYRMETKDIAVLYEIWCFIQVSHIVRDLMEDGVKVSHQNRMEMSNAFVYELGKGECSRILFEKDNVQLAELIYNPKSEEKAYRVESSLSIQNLVSPTVPQKPDIVLQLTKNDIDTGMKMTYLFDAKYRISGHEHGVDTPPDDAINQMHRYRDAIYYKQQASSEESFQTINDLRKEVIGGYILFPGAGEKSKIELSKYYKSINEVNIGAFPLRPDTESPEEVSSRNLLVDFIGNLLNKPAASIVREVIPQKGASITVKDRVLVGRVKSTNDLLEDYKDGFINGTAKVYYIESPFPADISLDNLHLFAPFVSRMGVRDVYEIKRIRTIGKEDKVSKDYILAIELGVCRQILDDFKMIDLSPKEMFKDTFLSEILGLSF